MGTFKQMGFWFSSFLLLIAALEESGAGDGICKVERCGNNLVRFPFRLPSQPPHCGYPGFNLSCSERKETLLHLPKLSNISVQRIDYIQQRIQVYDPDHCLPKKITSDPLSSSSFRFEEGSIYNFTLFSCPPEENRDLNLEIPCLSDTSSKVYAQSSDDYVNYFSLLHCTKMDDVLEVPYAMMTFQSEVLELSWNNPDCRDCEKQGGTCARNSNGTKFTTACHGGRPKHTDHSKGVTAAKAAEVRSAEVKCVTQKCSRGGPAVGYPFWLRDRQPECCGARNSGFELFCNHKKKTVLRLPNSVNLSVRHIDHKAHRIDLYDPDDHVLNKIRYLKLSDSAPFRFFNPQRSKEIVLFGPPTDEELEKNVAPCSSIRVIPAGDQLITTVLVGCSRISDVIRIPMKLYDKIHKGLLNSEEVGYEVQLSWHCWEKRCSGINKSCEQFR